MASLGSTQVKGNWSDSEGDEEEHARFLAAVAKLDRKKHVQPSIRKEPSLQVSEFHLSKESDDQSDKVHLWQLAKSISQRPSHKDVVRRLKSVQRKSLTLPKPLEKHEANRVQREVGYDDVKKQLGVWDPIVFNNRVSDDLVFPLNSSHAQPMLSKEEFLSNNQQATELEMQFEEILCNNISEEKEKEDSFSLSLQEMVERRKELASLRARESYRHAKAHYQKKIKSKKYHRLARKEHIRNQLKEFENLQAKDPEAALQKLEELEKERVLERASLRHRSTGKWAQNQAVRAKYDKESRQVLSEQLKLSKVLTQKVKDGSDSSDCGGGDDDDDDETLMQADKLSNNPWVSSREKTKSEVDQFLSGYRKFWEAKHSQEGCDANDEKTNALNGSVGKISQQAEGFSTSMRDEQNTAQREALKSAVVSLEVYPSEELSKNTVTNSLSACTSPPTIELKNSFSNCSQSIAVSSKSVEAPEIIKTSNGKWMVTPCEKSPKYDAPDQPDIHDMFDNLKERFAIKATKKLRNLKKTLKANDIIKPTLPEKKRITERNDELFMMKKQKLEVDLDEELFEDLGKCRNQPNRVPDVPVTFQSEEMKTTNKVPSKHMELDPNKFITPVPVKLNTLLPDEISGGTEGLDDSDEEEHIHSKHLTISEAFADDDVVAEFSKEKEELSNMSKSRDIDLGLPGWGEWGGHKIKSNTRKRKRFIVKMPEAPPRKDENKGDLIINEKEDSTVRPLQVNNLPFPFKRVRDFEASIRAPISNTFIPQSAHRKLIKPPIRTKVGAIITPMDKSVLLKSQTADVENVGHIKLHSSN